jgi:hypothetical protein
MFNDNDIIIPTFAQRATADFSESAIIARRALRDYDKIRENLQWAGCNGLAGMIGICITRGLHDSRDICRALGRPPFIYADAEVENLLKVHAGNDPQRHFWYMDEQGLYHLHANRCLRRLTYGMKGLTEAA